MSQNAAERREGRGHAELSRVELARPVDSEAGTLPAGSVGTVVHVYPQALAYEVEFNLPFHTVVTVEATALRG
jgi:Na+-transporting NADH:ubiquinone oxidoreductase subunit NqrA